MNSSLIGLDIVVTTLVVGAVSLIVQWTPLLIIGSFIHDEIGNYADRQDMREMLYRGYNHKEINVDARQVHFHEEKKNYK